MKYTYEGYRSAPEDKRYKLHDEELILTAAPRRAPQRTEMKITLRLGNHVEENDLGEVYSAPFNQVLRDTDVVQPDLFFVSEERRYSTTTMCAARPTLSSKSCRLQRQASTEISSARCTPGTVSKSSASWTPTPAT